MKRIPTLLCGLVLLLTGCVSNMPMDVTKAGRESILPAGLVLPNVRLTTKLATAEDVLSQMGSTFNVQSGKVYRQVFTGEEGAPARLELVNSSITQSMSDVMILGTKSNVTYTATLLFTYGDGKQQMITSTGTAATAWTVDRAAREAVERVVVDVAKQCQVYLAQ
jgi:hypothetical protein